MKRVFIVHRWGGSPNADWYEWLKEKLEKKGFHVTIPTMPNPDTPEITSWVNTLRKAVGKPDSDTFFVGHSIGCQTILRYLESLPNNVKVGGAVFVAGWFVLTPESTPTEQEQKIAKPWLEQQINFKKVRSHIDKMVTILSDNDPYVPLIENQCDFDTLGAKIIVQRKKGHYDTESKTFTLPVALKALLGLA